MQKDINDIAIFLIAISALVAIMFGFIVLILVYYRKQQANFKEEVEKITIEFQRTQLETQLEIQEQTFQHISREIHDNITLSLTLAKLQLHTIDLMDYNKSIEKLESSITLLRTSIRQLSDISKGLNADIIAQHGLKQALEEEITRIRQADPFKVTYNLTGTPIYLDAQKELFIFRIIQEAFNNIIKHASAKNVALNLNYCDKKLEIEIIDDGVGFDLLHFEEKGHAGLKNMRNRVRMLKGLMTINSQSGKGTNITYQIPYE